MSTNNKYYKVLYLFNKTHPEAKAACQADGARLASAPYGLPNNDAMAMFNGQSAATITYFLVDGTDAAAEGAWVLPDGIAQMLKFHSHLFCLGVADMHLVFD
jgi:hypothetical protein